MSVSLVARTRRLRLPQPTQAESFLFGDKPVVFTGRPLVMGIVNVTPDSFSDGGRFRNPGQAVDFGLKLVEEGADLLDIGGESTRPGAAAVPVAEELSRVIPVVAGLARRVSVPLSVDTSKAEVARQALDAGASVINDVTALRADAAMAQVASRAKASVILMHMQGTPSAMQQAPRYSDVVEAVSLFLKRRVEASLEAGIDASRIWIDPGLGFGKTVSHNLSIMNSLSSFVKLKFPVLIGPSRKSFIGAALDAEVSDRLAGTLACLAWAYQCGVSMVRVHDVKPALDLFKMMQSIRES